MRGLRSMGQREPGDSLDSDTFHGMMSVTFNAPDSGGVKGEGSSANGNTKTAVEAATRRVADTRAEIEASGEQPTVEDIGRMVTVVNQNSEAAAMSSGGLVPEARPGLPSQRHDATALGGEDVEDPFIDALGVVNGVYDQMGGRRSS